MIEGEAPPDRFSSISYDVEAIETLTTLGYGDVVPVTIFGKIVAGVTTVIGVAGSLVTSLITVGFMGQQRLRRETLSDVVEAGGADGALTAGEIAVIGQTTGAPAWLRPQPLETIGDTARELAGRMPACIATRRSILPRLEPGDHPRLGCARSARSIFPAMGMTNIERIGRERHDNASDRVDDYRGGGVRLGRRASTCGTIVGAEPAPGSRGRTRSPGSTSHGAGAGQTSPDPRPACSASRGATVVDGGHDPRAG